MKVEIRSLKEQIVQKDGEDPIESLMKEKLPLILYGGGSMSYSIRKILNSHNIKIAACWIDNAISEKLDDIPIMSYECICEKYEKFNVIFGHSKYELADKISIRENVNKCYCLVNVCYGQWKHLSYKTVASHMNEYFETISLLEDDLSRQALIAFLNCKISEDYHFLLKVCTETASYFNNPFFKIQDDEILVDAGAYVGDTIQEFISKGGCKYNKIYAYEPEKNSYNALQEYVETNQLANVELGNWGLWDKNTVLSFSDDDESSSIVSNGVNQIAVKCLDDILEGEKVSMIKINYYDGLLETLRGARNILMKQKPNLAVMVGFDEKTIISVPQLIKKINPNYKLSLRYAAAMPCRLILFAY